MRANTWRSLVLVLVVLLTAQVSLDAGRLPNVSVAETAGPSTCRIVTLSGGWIRGSVALGDLNGDGVSDIVGGGTDGKVYAYTGSGVTLWEYDTGDAAIEGKAAIGDINGDGWSEVVIGVGSTFTPLAPGAVWAFDHNGTPLWSYPSGDFNGDGISDGVYSSPSVADVDGNDNGKLEIIYGGYDGYIRVLNHDGTLLWERFVRDSIWSSPAIGDIDCDGKPEIVIGVDSHWEPAFGTEDGGMLYVLNGEDGSVLTGFPKQIDEVIWSSPVLGDLNGDGWLEIVVGTGDCWSDPVCAPGGRTHPVTKALYGWDHLGDSLPGWPIYLSDYAFASPALGDLDGDGELEVVVNTNAAYVHAFHSDGRAVAGWPALVTTPSGPGTVVHFATRASPVLTDLTGDGYPEVVLPSNWEIVVWDREGHQLTRDSFPSAPGQWELTTEYSVGGTPAVGDVDGDGKQELIIGGARSNGHPGALYIWGFDDVPRSAPAPWPAFRRDAPNHARYPLPPTLFVWPDSLFLFHSYGDTTGPTASLSIENRGDGTITWETTTTDQRVSVSPQRGSVSLETAQVTITIDLDGTAMLTETYDLGDITVTGTTETGPANGSPAVIPITVYVGTVHRVFIPVALRNE